MTSLFTVSACVICEFCNIMFSSGVLGLFDHWIQCRITVIYHQKQTTEAKIWNSPLNWIISESNVEEGRESRSRERAKADRKLSHREKHNGETVKWKESCQRREASYWFVKIQILYLLLIFFKHGLNLIPRGGLQVKDFQTPLCCCCPDSVIMGRFESISTWTQTEMVSGGDGAEVSRWHVSLAAVAERSLQELRFSWEEGAAGAACYMPTCWSLPVHWGNHSLWFSLSS